MDSDPKEFWHERAANRKTVWAYLGQRVVVQSGVGNCRKFAHGSHVCSRSRSKIPKEIRQQVRPAAPVSHQKRPRQSATNAIEPERKRCKRPSGYAWCSHT